MPLVEETEVVEPVEPTEVVEPVEAEVTPEPPLEAGAEEGAAAEEVGEDGKPVFKPNFKMSILDKEVEIPKNLQKFMTDKASETEIRDLFSKASGVDHLKSRNAELTQKSTQFEQENSQIKGSIDGLRNIYQSAVSTGNWHKLDVFFERMQIPQQHILQYAIEKAKLAEMEGPAKDAVLAQIAADRRADQFASQQTQVNSANHRMLAEIKQLQIGQTLAQPDVMSLQNEYEGRTGQPGSFKQMMQKYGELEWLRSNGKVDLTPSEVVSRIAKDFGLKGTVQSAATPAAAANGNSSVPGKPVVQRTDKVIPNIQGEAGKSPLKSKPKSLDDLRKLKEQAWST